MQMVYCNFSLLVHTTFRQLGPASDKRMFKKALTLVMTKFCNLAQFAKLTKISRVGRLVIYNM